MKARVTDSNFSEAKKVQQNKVPQTKPAKNRLTIEEYESKILASMGDFSESEIKKLKAYLGEKSSLEDIKCLVARIDFEENASQLSKQDRDEALKYREKHKETKEQLMRTNTVSKKAKALHEQWKNIANEQTSDH